MLEFIVNTVLPLAGTAAVGAAGWFVTNYVLQPWLKFLRIRQEIQASILFVGNVVGDDALELGKARDEIRRHGATVAGIEASLGNLLGRYARLRGYDLDGAVTGLIGLSNTLHTAQAINRYNTQTALRLPPTDSPEDVAAVKAGIKSGRIPS